MGEQRNRLKKWQYEALDNQIVALLEDFNPQLVRQVFYRQVQPDLPIFVPKDVNGYRLIDDRLKLLRRNGRVPYSWIIDPGRYTLLRYDTSLSGADWTIATAGAYQRDPWADSESQVRMVCESRSIAIAIKDICTEYRVDLWAATGDPSDSFMYQLGQRLLQDGRPCIIPYFGDYDAAGMRIHQEVIDKLHYHTQGQIPVDLHRLGINHDQIAQYNLPTIEPKPDELKKNPAILENAEAESMPMRQMRQLITDELESLIPDGSLAEAINTEKRHQADIRLRGKIVSGYLPNGDFVELMR